MKRFPPLLPNHPEPYAVDPCPFCFGPAVIDSPWPNADVVTYSVYVDHRDTCALERDADIIHFPYWTSRDWREIEARWNYRPKNAKEAEEIFG